MIAARVLAIACLGTSSAIAAAPDWLQWRGPGRDGRIHGDAAPWPDTLAAENLRKLWSVDLAEGYSSPITSGRRVFTVETRDKMRKSDGKTVWKALEDERGMFGSAFSSPIRATIAGRAQILDS